VTRFLIVCGAGAIGSGVRYLVALALGSGRGFPFATLAVNIIGSFAMAIAMGIAAERLSPEWRLALTTGLLGGFTTYSAFSYETTTLLGTGDWPRAAAYVVATLIGCGISSWLGFIAMRG
jgi:fluoride exporter